MELKDQFLQKLNQGDLTVAVIGLGYVGLPLALSFARAGVRVIGLDIDSRKKELLQAGKSYINYIEPAAIEESLATGNLIPEDDFNQLAKADAVLLCLPTPLDEHFEPDMSYIIENCRLVAGHLKLGMLVILESTTYPGTTEGLVKNLLEESGLKAGEDFFLAFSPEREDPGRRDESAQDIPRVCGGINAASCETASALYRKIASQVINVSGASVAEAAKLTENIFRSVNIALVNELKIIYDRMGINIWEVLDAAETKPFGYMRFDPGPGWGGHCIPIDPFYLSWKAKELGLSTRFIELAGQINISMPYWVLDKLQAALNDHRKPVNGSRILLLGMSYKKNVDDTRESPGLVIFDELLKRGADVDFHDPLVQTIPPTRKFPQLQGLKSRDLTEELVENCDAVLLITDHDSVDYEMIVQRSTIFIDTRGLIQRKLPHLTDKVIRA